MTPPHKPKYVCECLKVTEAALVKAIRARKLATLKDVISCTGAGEGCTACHPAIKEYLERERKRGEPPHHNPHHHGAHDCAARQTQPA